MTTVNHSTENPASDQQTVVLERIFNAPQELVFKAWTDPKLMAQWWGPKYFTNPVCVLDVRPGGAILIHMRGPDGTIFPMKGEFIEIAPPERLVMIGRALEEKEGNFLLESLTTVTLVEHEGKTKLTMHAVVTKAAPGAADALAGMEEGWNQSLDKLEDFLANQAYDVA